MDVKKYIRESKRPLVLDGAIGSLLQQNGIHFDDNYWTIKANVEQPEMVKNIYQEYLNAGADILTTNTFRTNPAAYKISPLNIGNEEFVYKSVEIVKSIKLNNVLIAGCNPPAEDSYKVMRELSEEELIGNHQNHIKYLWESGVDFILNETMSHLDEIIISAEYCYENHIPFVTSLFFNKNLKILSGEDILEVIHVLQKYEPIITSFNCVSLEDFETLIERIDLSKIMFGFYLNCGSGDIHDKEISCGVSPQAYLDFIKKYLELNPQIIGSCCGSNAEHTKIIRNLVDEVY